MEILCGARALRYLSTAYDQARAVGQRLSVKPLEIQGAVERLEEELSAAKARMADLEQTVFAALAAEQAGLADTVGKSCGGLAAVFSGEGAKWSYALVRGDGGDIAPLVKELNETLHGRGGGRNGFAQGSVQAGRGEIEAFFRR